MVDVKMVDVKLVDVKMVNGTVTGEVLCSEGANAMHARDDTHEKLGEYETWQPRRIPYTHTLTNGDSPQPHTHTHTHTQPHTHTRNLHPHDTSFAALFLPRTCPNPLPLNLFCPKAAFAPPPAWT